jgi:hypothetical protein
LLQKKTRLAFLELQYLSRGKYGGGEEAYSMFFFFSRKEEKVVAKANYQWFCYGTTKWL